MTETFMEKLLRWAAQAQENIDPAADTLDSGETVYFVRFRPWKQVKGREVMNVGHGDTLEEAARAALASWKNGGERKLDWAHRPWRSDRSVGSASSRSEDIPF